MHIGVIYICDRIAALVLTADDNSLRQLRKSIFLCLFSPFVRCKRYPLVGSADFCFGGEPRRAMLSIADCFTFDIVEAIDMR